MEVIQLASGGIIGNNAVKGQKPAETPKAEGSNGESKDKENGNTTIQENTEDTTSVQKSNNSKSKRSILLLIIALCLAIASEVDLRRRAKLKNKV